jgi:hypothetical protein
VTKTAKKSNHGGPLPPELESQPFLDSLPELDAPLAARRLRERLEALTRVETDPATRYTALAALESRVASVTATLAGRQLTLSLPVSGRALEELDSIRQLQQTLARAWLRVVHELPDKGAQQLPRRERELQGSARIHALRTLTDVLLSSYRYYREPPKGLWHDIHQAYWRGVYPEAAGKPRHSEEVQAAAMYARALLLGLCGAEQLPYRAIDRVALSLDRDWKLDSLIMEQSTGKASERSKGMFLIDPASDRPAAPAYSGIRALPTDQILDTGALVQQLRERFENLVRNLTNRVEDGKLPPDFGELEMLRSLIRKWGGQTLRRQVRTPIRTSGEILGGLSRIYQTFSADDRSGDSGREIVLSAADVLQTPFQQERPPLSPAPARWIDVSLEDQSDEGLRIRIQRQTGTYVTVGDLVCTRHTRTADGAEIGVIVRARAIAPDDAEFGIHRLGVGKDTALVYLVGNDKTPGDIENLGTPFRALVLRRSKTQSELIIADKGLYRPGATLWATWGGEIRIIRAGTLFLSTRNFDAFAFSSTVSAGHPDDLFAKPGRRSSGPGGDQDAII